MTEDGPGLYYSLNKLAVYKIISQAYLFPLEKPLRLMRNLEYFKVMLKSHSKKKNTPIKKKQSIGKSKGGEMGRTPHPPPISATFSYHAKNKEIMSLCDTSVADSYLNQTKYNNFKIVVFMFSHHLIF